MSKDLQNKTDKDLIIELGQRIKELRIQNNMTQLDVAIKMNIDPTALRRYEKGKVEMGFTMLIRFAEVFSVTLDKLLTFPISNRVNQ